MKKKLMFLICFTGLILSKSFSQQDVNGWYWLNGKPTGNNLNWVKIVDAANIYAVGARGTFMKSVDGGDTWTINSQVGSPDISSTGGGSTLQLLTGWFFNASTGIVAGQSSTLSNGRISKTTDGGNSWNYIQYDPTGGSVRSLYFVNSNTGYMAGSGTARFLKSTNQGITWVSQPYSPPLPSVTIAAVFALDTGNIFAINAGNKSVYYHKQGMDSAWKVWNLPGTTSSLTDILFKDVNTGYVCGTGSYFAYTTNGGNTWTQHSPSSNIVLKDLDYGSGILYAAGNSQYLYKSSNNGINWDSIYFRDNSNPNQPSVSAGGNINGLSVNGSDLTLVGQTGIVNMSNDGGSSWRNKNYSVTNNVLAVTYASILVQSSGSSVGNIWLGPYEGGHVLYSSNAGANWTSRNSQNTLTVMDINFPNSNTGYISGGSAFQGIGEMSKTINGGLTWTALSLPTPMNSSQINNMSFINANTGWVSSLQCFQGCEALIYKTTNGGVSWSPQSLEGNPEGGILSVQMTDANRGFALYTSLYTTSNGGVNWLRVNDPYISTVSWIDMFVFSKDIIYLNGFGATDETRKIIRSKDGGATWTDLTSNILTSVSVFKTYWINLKHGVVSGTNGYVGKTTDGGLTWSSSNPGGSTTVDLAMPGKNEIYTVSDRNSAYEVWRKYDYITSISLNVTMGIQGFWNGKPMITDTVTAELHNSASPYNELDEEKEVVTINGYVTYEFNNVPSGSYYIVLKHRNSLETWSSVPVVMNSGGNYNFDFTTSSAQAFGNNTILKSGIYCVYSGDVNQDQIIDAGDLANVENEQGNSGYLSEDVTGDDFTDASDLAIVENNQGILVYAP